MVSNFNSSEDILFGSSVFVCYLAGFIKKKKRIKAFVNELMCDSSDAKWRQKVIGITFEFNSLHSLFLSERDGTLFAR